MGTGAATEVVEGVVPGTMVAEVDDMEDGTAATLPPLVTAGPAGRDAKASP